MVVSAEVGGDPEPLVNVPDDNGVPPIEVVLVRSQIGIADEDLRTRFFRLLCNSGERESHCGEECRKPNSHLPPVVSASAKCAG